MATVEEKGGDVIFILSAILRCPLPGISQRGQLRLEGNKKDKVAG